MQSFQLRKAAPMIGVSVCKERGIRLADAHLFIVVKTETKVKS
jgi:hypothetical protein